MNLREVFFKSEPRLEPNLPFPRCQHRSPAGRQCSQPICSTSPEFCFTHRPMPEDILIAELTEAAGGLSNPEEIHRFLTRVTLLRVRGRLTPKEACSYAYLCQILQRGQREIAFHQKLRENRAEREAEQARSKAPLLNWNIPRPDRSDPSDPPSNTTPDTTAQTSPLVGAGLVYPESSRGDRPSSPTATTSSSSSTEGEPPVCHPDRSSGVFPLRSGGTAATNATPAPTDGINAPSCEISVSKKFNSPKKSSPAAAPAPKPLPPDFHNHFFPIDLTLPPGSQDLTKNIPHPDAAECARRNARRGLDFKRRASLLRFW